ncbi:hypothetical protein NL676_023771 [Syzygium grande]|nr:hypothetical protein NL676_023771 [Syzygium grande]
MATSSDLAGSPRRGRPRPVRLSRLRRHNSDGLLGVAFHKQRSAWDLAGVGSAVGLALARREDDASGGHHGHVVAAHWIRARVGPTCLGGGEPQ